MHNKYTVATWELVMRNSGGMLFSSACSRLKSIPLPPLLLHHQAATRSGFSIRFAVHGDDGGKVEMVLSKFSEF